MILPIVPYSDLVSGWSEGRPRNVEPARARQQLVGMLVLFEEVYQALELLWVEWPDVGSLAHEVLRVSHASHPPVHLLTTEAGVDDDRSDHLSRRLQQQDAPDVQVHKVLERGDVLGILLQMKEFAKSEMWRKLYTVESFYCNSHDCFLSLNCRAM